MLAAIDRRLDAILQSAADIFPLKLEFDSNTVDIEYVNGSLTCKCAEISYKPKHINLATGKLQGEWRMGDDVSVGDAVTFLQTGNVTLINFNYIAYERFR
jgi:hypothetical protein